MKRFGICTSFLAFASLPVLAQNITNVVEINGDNETTDTIAAKWTGQTFTTSVANEPTPNTPVGTVFTVPTFGHQAPVYVDRNHRFSDHSTDPAAIPPTFTIPAYLIGGEYIMSGNDNRDNQPPTIPAPYRLDVTVANPVTAYMLIDNRLGGGAADPPTFDATHMQWILDQGWVATNNGLNRTANPLVPDEVPLDEGGDNTIQNWFSVYRKDFPAGTFSLHQPDNAGQNMYSVVITPVPEPSALALLGLAGIALAKRRRA